MGRKVIDGAGDGVNDIIEGGVEGVKDGVQVSNGGRVGTSSTCCDCPGEGEEEDSTGWKDPDPAMEGGNEGRNAVLAGVDWDVDCVVGEGLSIRFGLQDGTMEGIEEAVHGGICVDL